MVYMDFKGRIAIKEEHRRLPANAFFYFWSQSFSRYVNLFSQLLNIIRSFIGRSQHLFAKGYIMFSACALIISLRGGKFCSIKVIF